MDTLAQASMMPNTRATIGLVQCVTNHGHYTKIGARFLERTGLTGENAEAFADVVQDLLHKDNGKEDAGEGLDSSMMLLIIESNFRNSRNPEDLTVEDKITVSGMLVNNTKNRDFFFSLPDQAKGVMVKMMLDGRYKPTCG
ncbi:hypothetical protein BUALT_Bualt16G0069700 [Buddleja alternifolia]|uniref:Uncharacterized protein n=1 Tax=Buddleja alternifolia TaxID=168488 RepID=A0AAV6WG20_9LAMI|nr:hypothetical protein BUALT_Bualt16G0069700 [Buddleja alternifolia]